MPRLPPHPGSMVRDEMMMRGLTAGAVAKAIRVPRTRIERLIAGKTRMTPDTAIRLARFIGQDSLSAAYLMGLQGRYDLAICAKRIAKPLAAIVPHKPERL